MHSHLAAKLGDGDLRPWRSGEDVLGPVESRRFYGEERWPSKNFMDPLFGDRAPAGAGTGKPYLD